MKGAIKKEIVNDLIKAKEIIQKKDASTSLKLKQLSDHAIEDVAVQKDMDLVSITVDISSYCNNFT